MSRRHKHIKDLLPEYLKKANEALKKFACVACLGNVRLSESKKGAKCTRKKCRKTFPLFKNKTLNKSRLRIAETLKVVEMILNGVKNRYIRRVIGLDRKAVYRLKKNLKYDLKKMFWKKATKIGGQGIIIEADESKFGKRKNNRGHQVEGVWVIGMVERSIERKILLFIVRNRTGKLIQKLFSKFVHNDSIIYTDSWPGYNSLKNTNLTHMKVNHSKWFVDPHTGVHTNTIEGNWSAIKAEIPKRYRVKKWIGLYLIMFMIKRNLNTEPIDYYIKNLF